MLKLLVSIWYRFGQCLPHIFFTRQRVSRGMLNFVFHLNRHALCRINPLTTGIARMTMIGPNVNITGIARSTYYASRANGSKAARACFRPKILERKS